MMEGVQVVRVIISDGKYKMLKLFYREPRCHWPARIFLDDYVKHMLNRLGFFGFSSDATYLAIRDDFEAVLPRYNADYSNAVGPMLSIALRVQQFGKNAASRKRAIIELEGKIVVPEKV